MFFIVEACGLVSLIFYWIKTGLLIRNYPHQEEKELSYHQAIFLFLKFFLAALLLFICLWTVSFITTNFLGQSFTYINYEVMWISTPAFIYVVGYFSLRQPEIFRVAVETKAKSEKDRLKPDEIQKLQKRLNYFIGEEKVFMQPNLTLKALAEKLNTSPNNLSWLLNQVYQTTFYDYVNKHRVQEFIQKTNQGAHLNHTLLALAMDVGFNSKSTFNKAFKQETGKTPSAYIKSKEVA